MALDYSFISNNKDIIELDKPVIYSQECYDLSPKLDGEGVRIAILDSGYPSHKDLPYGSNINLSLESTQNIDVFGHATMVSGVIFGNNSKNGIKGIAPASTPFYAKICEDNGECHYSSLVSGILWAIANKVDVISISLSSSVNNSLVKDAIKKAVGLGICVIAATGTKASRAKDIQYPAKYDDVLAVGTLKKGNKLGKYSAKTNSVKVILPGEDIVTTYLDNTYIKISGTSMSCALASGLVALIIQDCYIKKHIFNVFDIYKKIQNITYRPN